MNTAFYWGVAALLAVACLNALGKTLSLRAAKREHGDGWRHEYYKALMYQGASRKVAYDASRSLGVVSAVIAIVTALLASSFVMAALAA